MTHYLTEDLSQIQRYFPGAEPVALITPFDITVGESNFDCLGLDTDAADVQWPEGVLLWTM